MSDVTLAAVLDEYLQKFKPSSKKSIRRDLIPFRDWVGAARPIEEISNWDVLRYVNSRINCDTCNGGKPYAQNTRRTKIKHLRTFFSWCVKNRLVRDNPTDILDVPAELGTDTRERAFDEAERGLLIDYAAGRTTLSGERLRDLALFLFCHDTGVRVSSLEILRRGDIDLEQRVARVFNTKKRGGAKAYFVRFGDYCAVVLARWFAVLPANPSAYLWNSRTPGAFTDKHNISQVIGRACDRVGIPRRSVHAFRHAVAHRLTDAGYGIGYVARVLNDTEKVAQQYYAPKDTEGAWDAALSVSYKDAPAGENIIPFRKIK